MSGERVPMFPILGDTYIRCIPWAMISPHEPQAQSNHGQSLKRLAERGGLDAGEAVDVLLGRKWSTTKDYPWARAKLMILIMHFERDKAKTQKEPSDV